MYDRPDLYRSGSGVLCGGGRIRPALREDVRAGMENIIVGVVALLLFVYLLVAMIRPEKF
jgi:K+-transporting ATPase KdpF subunit